jgi:hypothetical protein
MALFTRLIIRLFQLVFSARTIFFSHNKSANSGPVHPAYNPSFSACFFQPEQYFSLTTNQSTVFFSQLISTAERDQYFSADLSVQPNRDDPPALLPSGLQPYARSPDECDAAAAEFLTGELFHRIRQGSKVEDKIGRLHFFCQV